MRPGSRREGEAAGGEELPAAAGDSGEVALDLGGRGCARELTHW